jgi:hypothetical protein
MTDSYFLHSHSPPIHPPIHPSIHIWLYSSCGAWPLFQFLNLYTVGRNPWTVDQPVARPLPTHRTTQTHNKLTETSMPRVGFEPTIPILERAKTFHALDPAAIVIGSLETYSVKYCGNTVRVLYIELCYARHYTLDGDVKMESSLEFISLPAPATFAPANLPTLLRGRLQRPSSRNNRRERGKERGISVCCVCVQERERRDFRRFFFRIMSLVIIEKLPTHRTQKYSLLPILQGEIIKLNWKYKHVLILNRFKWNMCLVLIRVPFALKNSAGASTRNIAAKPMPDEFHIH